MTFIDYIQEAADRGFPVNPDTTRLILCTKQVLLLPVLKDKADFTPHDLKVVWIDEAGKLPKLKRWLGKVFDNKWGQYKVCFCDCPACTPYKNVEIDTSGDMGYSSLVDVLAVYAPEKL